MEISAVRRLADGPLGLPEMPPLVRGDHFQRRKHVVFQTHIDRPGNLDLVERQTIRRFDEVNARCKSSNLARTTSFECLRRSGNPRRTSRAADDDRAEE